MYCNLSRYAAGTCINLVEMQQNTQAEVYTIKQPCLRTLSLGWHFKTVMLSGAFGNSEGSHLQLEREPFDTYQWINYRYQWINWPSLPYFKISRLFISRCSLLSSGSTSIIPDGVFGRARRNILHKCATPDLRVLPWPLRQVSRPRRQPLSASMALRPWHLSDLKLSPSCNRQ